MIALLTGKTVSFTYKGVARKLLVEETKVKGGRILLIGKDEARNGEYRSFYTDKIQSYIKIES